MNKFITLLLLVLVTSGVSAQTKLLSPAAFLGYELGDRFTPHYKVVEYFRHVQDANPNVKLNFYGETYEHRPLLVATIASTENFKNLEQIRQDNLKRAGALDGTPSGNKVAIVWLSYNVHGNEANSTEASMKTLYALVDPENAKAKEWLKNTVVMIDPCVNPDGRDRYVNFYTQYQNTPATSDPQSKEHHEPWPGGRANHYLFDLNRDWAWETQQESQARLKIYNQWLPHVHVDFHEQSPNTPYYFAPAAEPYHEVISPWQREFQVTIGKNHAKYFDEQGWLYFTKEVFDLFYPGYGDTYPLYSGAIGMTYEKAGGGGAGLTYTTREGDPMTLKDRLTHHYTTGISTIEISSLNATRLVDEFEKYNHETINTPSFTYKSYVIKGDNNPDKINKIAAWMASHSIQFGYAGAGKASRGYEYRSQTMNNFNLTTEDLVVNVYQPKGRFINTVFEPSSRLPDSLTYDITAWNLMYAHDLKAYAVTEKIAVAKPFTPLTASSAPISGKPYSYIFRYQSLKDVEFLAALMQKGIKVRAATKSFSVGGQAFEPGSLIVTRRNNESVADFDNLVQSLAKTADRKIFTSTTGFVEKGADFGSGDVNYLRPPKVAVVGGNEASSLGLGEVWHYFEQQIHYPVSVIGTDYLSNIDLYKYTVLVVPEGNYRVFDDRLIENIQRWVSDGNKLILVGSALRPFADHKGFALKEYATEDKKKDAEKAEKEARAKEGPPKYGDTQRKSLSESISGAIYKVTLDRSHPLAFGLTEYYSLKTGERHFDYLEDAWNVGVLGAKAKPVMGYAGFKINKQMSNTLIFGVEEKGRGQIVYFVDNPMFRSFWETGKIVFSNAVFMVGE